MPFRFNNYDECDWKDEISSLSSCKVTDSFYPHQV